MLADAMRQFFEFGQAAAFSLGQPGIQIRFSPLCQHHHKLLTQLVGSLQELCRLARLVWGLRDILHKRPYRLCFSHTPLKLWNEEQHTAVGKETGETAHVERWNNTLRQRLARFVRMTLSFSKSVVMHEACLLLFLHRYNLDRAILLK